MDADNPMFLSSSKDLKLERKMTDVLMNLLLTPKVDPETEEKFNLLLEMLGQVNVAPADGTRMICAECGSINAIGYKLRRSAGKYMAYCVDEFGGCIGKQLTHQCNLVDHIGMECDQLAEYQITYGADELITRYACVMHTGILLKDTKNTVHPIK
jgi:hypothetical protein